MLDRTYAGSGRMVLLEFVNLLVGFFLGILNRPVDFVAPLASLVGGGIFA